jgi:hypothetical protein
MPEIAEPDVHRVMVYLDAVNQNGYQPTAQELDVYGKQPDRSVTVRGGFAQLAAQAGGLSAIYATLTGTREVESFSAHLVRLRWARESDGRHEITENGAAVLRALNVSATMSDSSVIQTVLGAEDPIAYARVVSTIADMDDVLIVDPYLKIDQLPDLFRLTSVKRILTSSERKSADKKSVPFVAASSIATHEVEMRQDLGNDLHDRYFIPASGAVQMISTSLNGIGLRLSVLTPLDSEASRAVREAHEAIWTGATPMRANPPVSPPPTD